MSRTVTFLLAIGPASSLLRAGPWSHHSPNFGTPQGWVIYLKTRWVISVKMGWVICVKNQPSKWVISMKADTGAQRDAQIRFSELLAPRESARVATNHYPQAWHHPD
jgi:hypothetical protein